MQAGSQPPPLTGIRGWPRPSPSPLPIPNPQVLGQLPDPTAHRFWTDTGFLLRLPSGLTPHPSRGPQEAPPLFFKVLPVQTRRQAQPPIKTLSPNSSLGPQHNPLPCHCSATPWEDPQHPPLSPGSGLNLLGTQPSAGWASPGSCRLHSPRPSPCSGPHPTSFHSGSLPSQGHALRDQRLGLKPLVPGAK